MCIITEFETNVDTFQIIYVGVETFCYVLLRFENRFVKLLNNNERKCKKNSSVN